MNVFGELVLITWPLIIFFTFFINKSINAVLICIIFGWLFLPVGESSILSGISGLPEYTKMTAISLGLIIGRCVKINEITSKFKITLPDIFIIIFCLCPLPTSILNGLGFYDGLSGIFNQVITYGIPFFFGRKYFKSDEDLRVLCLALIYSGLIYALLCLFEIRMSPKLHRTIYGFFQHDWIQHERFGGYRPLVFLNHGLMVATFMAIISTLSYWLWRSKSLYIFPGLPPFLILLFFMFTTALIKSVNGWFEVIIGLISYSLYKSKIRYIFLKLLVLLIPIYIIVRLFSVVPSNYLVKPIDKIITNEKRIASFETRLYQESLFSEMILNKPFFGWGGYNRGRPIDPMTGLRIRAVDSIWLIVGSTYGLIGLTSFFSIMLIPLWRLFRLLKFITVEAISLSIGVFIFTLDSLFNGMYNPIYFLITGAIVSYWDRSQVSISKNINKKHSLE